MNCTPLDKPALPAKPEAWRNRPQIQAVEAGKKPGDVLHSDEGCALAPVWLADPGRRAGQRPRPALSAPGSSPSPPSTSPSPPSLQGRWVASHDLLQRSRHAWYAQACLVLQAHPTVILHTVEQLQGSASSWCIDEMHPLLVQALDDREPAWRKLRLTSLVGLLAGEIGDTLGIPVPPPRAPTPPSVPVPLIMVTPPDEPGHTGANPAAYLAARYATTPEQAARREAAQVERERAWLDYMMGLLRLPSPQAQSTRRPTTAARSATSSKIPPSLASKLSEHNVVWQKICVGELVELVVALHLVP